MTMTSADLSNLLSQQPADPYTKRELGVVVGGSISRGLVVRLSHETDPEQLAVGRYVVIEGEGKRYFCMISDIMLESTNPAIQADPPDISDPFLKQVYQGTMAYAKATVIPMLVIDRETGEIGPVKSIPAHFTKVRTATQDDVSRVFGSETDTNFFVGSPLELLETQINLDLKRLIERSVGVFGKSGTGKSFLTRLVLAGIIHRGVGQTLIFDMHNDYGWQATSEGATSVKGLKQLFESRVAVLTLDEESSLKRKAKIDYVVQIGYQEIQPEDIALLKNAMGFTDTMVDAANTLARLWKENWVQRVLEASAEDIEALGQHASIPSGTFDGLRRRLGRLRRWNFVTDGQGDSAKRIQHTIVEERKSVVLEFGRYGNQLEAYMFVANFLTRRIHNAYVDQIEKALGDNSAKPPSLVITIEEAHKFLEPQVARQTTFGIIARELRKYNVTLLVVDQRPSAIDDEVMSQIGTRITALLDNERDIAAVLNGINGAASLREVLARLDTKQQAIIMGHAVPMPVVIKPRTYDETFYASLVGGREKPQNPITQMNGRRSQQL